jgi:hypothetical protein
MNGYAGAFWDLPAADHDIGEQLGMSPYAVHAHARQPATAGADADFTEMLCQIDHRMDRALPECWILHPYLFALLDALRCQYAACYLPFMTKNGLHPPIPSAEQLRFWQDEDRTLSMIREYCKSQGVGDGEHECGIGHDEPSALSAATMRRRAFSAEHGIEPAGMYPWGASREAADDGRPVEAGHMPPTSMPSPGEDMEDDPGDLGRDADGGFVDPLSGAM